MALRARQYLSIAVAMILVAAFAAAQYAAAAPKVADAAVSKAPMEFGESTTEVRVKVRMLADAKGVEAGHPFKLGCELVMDPGWHTYYRECGDAGMPTKIEWTLPPGFTAGELLWQKPSRFDEAGIITYGYEGRTLIASVITPPAKITSSGPLQFSAKIKWLSCKEICLPGKGDASITLPVATSEPEADNQPIFARANFTGHISEIDHAAAPAAGNLLDHNFKLAPGEEPQSLPAALLLAVVGGFLLNLMPCVLPVIAIKILSFLEQSRDHPQRVQMLGLTFSAGIISSFMALAAIVLAVQAAGQQVGWGFQFQYPGFVIAMSVIVLLLALSLFGLFYVQIDAGTAGLNRLSNQEGLRGTFFKGVLATVLSTPCTAPFLGPALGFAFTQNWISVLLIFLSIGLGMSAPYLVLSARPEWIKFVPKPGDWMEKLKESFGFILLATVVWLLWVLGSQVGIEGVIWTAAFLVAVSLAAWIVARFTNLSSSQSQKAKVWAVAGAIVLVSFYYFIAIRPGIGFSALSGATGTPPNTVPAQIGSGASATGDTIDWQSFDLDRLSKDLSENKTVMLDFTAQWCLTCKVNEQAVLETKPIVDKIKALNVVPMRVDWTSQDATITKLMHKFNRSGVPLYVIFPAGKSDEPIVLPEIITPEIVLNALDQAGPSK